MVTLSPLALKSTAVASAFLVGKLFVTFGIQGSKKFKSGSRPPEDACFKFLADGKPQNFGITIPDDPETKKAK